MKNFKHKKILLAALGVISVAIIIIYTYVGSFVLQVFPRKDSLPEAASSSTDAAKNSDPYDHSYATLSEIDEKPVEPNSVQASPQLENQQTQDKKITPADERANSERRRFNFFGIKL